MTPVEAINILNLATEPNVKLSRGDYVRIQIALETLDKFVKQHPTEPLTAAKGD